MKAAALVDAAGVAVGLADLVERMLLHGERVHLVDSLATEMHAGRFTAPTGTAK